MIRPTVVPPTIIRDLPEPMWPLWPLMRPDFSFETGQISFLPKDLSTQQNVLRAAQRIGSEGLSRIAAARQAGAIQAWQLDLIEACARLKMGEAEVPIGLLAGLCDDPNFVASLKKPGSQTRHQLRTQHPLWLLAHIAVEMGSGAKLLPHLLDAGLRARSLKEPELASGLLTNALCCGAWDVFSTLLDKGWAMSPGDRGDLRLYLEELTQELKSAPADVFIYDLRIKSGLSPLCRACERLGVSTQSLTVYERRFEDGPKSSWRKAFISMVSPRGPKSNIRSQLEAPRRTTGIQVRMPPK